MANVLSSLYIPPKHSHKGENGKLFVIGGGRQYHGAPIFSLLAARRFVDLIYFYPGEKDDVLIRAAKRIPEVIVVSDLLKLQGCDCVLFGIGLGKAKLDLRKLAKGSGKIVVDADGLKRIKGKIPKGAIITPHEGEFKHLFGVKGTKENVKNMAKKHGCIILKKDPKGDIISDGKRTYVNKTHNAGMTKGGTGDVLAGLTAALACKNDSFRAACSAAYICGYAGNMLLKKFGYNFSASDLADELSKALFQLKRSKK